MLTRQMPTSNNIFQDKKRTATWEKYSYLSNGRNPHGVNSSMPTEQEYLPRATHQQHPLATSAHTVVFGGRMISEGAPQKNCASSDAQKCYCQFFQTQLLPAESLYEYDTARHQLCTNWALDQQKSWALDQQKNQASSKR